MYGTVYDGGGRRIGRTADLEGLFIDEAVATRRVEECYVVVGPDSSERFVRRLEQAGLPVVMDVGCFGTALIVSGQPAEWPKMKEGL